MKTFTLILLALLSVFKLQAQDYLIQFASDEASTPVETVKVENLTQGKSISLLGSDILHLKAIVTANIPLLEYLDYPLRVYPNPSNGDCTIEFGARKSGSATLKVFDPIGREIAKLQQTLSDGIHYFKVSGLGNSIYTVNVILDDQSYSEKIISICRSNSRLTISYIGNNGSLQEISKLKNATTERFWQYTTGDILSFTGTSGKFSTVIVDVPGQSKILTFNFVVSLPTLTTTAASNIKFDTATSGGNITTDGGSPITAKGVCWSTFPNPNTGNSKTNDGTGLGTFTSTLTGLTPNTTYYVRAYAINSGGNAFGNEVTFTTSVNPQLATLTTITPTSISNTSALSGGNITTTGGLPITAIGVCWSSTNEIPTIYDSKTTDGTAIGSFSSSITGLYAGTKYYMRAYATSSAGTGYGNPVTFTTTNTLNAEVIYYGISTETTVTAEYILANFTKTTGFVGSPTGRKYTFGPTFGTYRYWAIPDVPNTGERVIGEVTLNDASHTNMGMEPSQMSYYQYYQLNPNPPLQTIKYAKIDINGIVYRLYRTTYRYGSSTTILLVWPV